MSEQRTPFAERMHEFWTREAEAMWTLGQADLALKCARFAATWEYGGTTATLDAEEEAA